MNTERRVAWEKVNQSATPVPEMPRALGKLLIKYFKKEEPSSKVNSLKNLCSFSTFRVVLESYWQGRKGGPRRFVVERACSWHSRCQSWTQEGQKANSGRLGRVLYWQRVRMHFFGAGVQIWVGGFLQLQWLSAALCPCPPMSTCTVTPTRHGLHTVKIYILGGGHLPSC